MCQLTKVVCPRHEGAFDCNPFCNLCEGEQEYYPPCKQTENKFKPCEDCGAQDMDEYACDAQREYCLDCCGCPDHIVDEHNPSWRD